MKSFKSKCISLVGLMFIALAHATTLTALEVPAQFSKGAIVQCDLKIPIWGWGTPSKQVDVTMGNHTVSTTVDSEGAWRAVLPPMSASYDTHQILIKSEENSIRIEDVLVGEVWLCAGQSNMARDLEILSKRTKDAGYESVVAFNKKAATSDEDKFLRCLTVPRRASYFDGKTNFEGEWKETSPQNTATFSATAYFFAKALRKKLDKPVGIIVTAWGGKRIDPFIPPLMWKKKSEKTYTKAIERFESKKGNETAVPGAIYNGMINPLATYGIRGLIWYQGESHNGNRAETYHKLLEMLVTGLRGTWKQGDFPVYFCQLANLNKPLEEPLQERVSWVTICNAQRKARFIPNTDMAILNDIGQVKDIHPANKYDVGVRLSNLAIHHTYGFEEITATGPIYKSSKVEGANVIITFDYAQRGLMVGKKHLMDPAVEVDEPLGGFELCGKDGVWKSATAKIMKNNTVQVSHPEIPTPVGARYAWQKNPENANLYNLAGLPASLFTTIETKE